jgi:hypothetical protein
MSLTVAANDAAMHSTARWVRDDLLGMDLPKDHRGPVVLSDTGRKVWWTGRVAIGLRYQPPHRSVIHGQSALWLQDLLLKCG